MSEYPGTLFRAWPCMYPGTLFRAKGLYVPRNAVPGLGLARIPERCSGPRACMYPGTLFRVSDMDISLAFLRKTRPEQRSGIRISACKSFKIYALLTRAESVF